MSAPANRKPVIEEIIALFQQRGGSQYGGEAVTQLEHALQAATFAEREGAAPTLIAAALIHDVGHLLHELPDDAPDQGVDDRHETLAAAWLAERLGPPVVAPVAMHVAAKRYLCTVDTEYFGQLSQPSVQSLALQGGPMSSEEIDRFRTRPYFQEAVRLRRWDDAAKVVGMKTPGLEHFARYLDLVLEAGALVDAQNVAIVGAGIVGVAHAWSAAQRGHRVTLFERSPRASGASIRNFGMIWPIGQPAGEWHEVALESREQWLKLQDAAGVWINPCGSIHLAHRADEWAVLQEFEARAAGLGFECSLLSASQVQAHTPAANPAGLLGGLFSPTELCVNPRLAIRQMPRWLAERFAVRLAFGTAVKAVTSDGPRGEIKIESSSGASGPFDRVVICGGIEFQTLFPQEFARSELRLCKLQMLKTAAQPAGWKLGPHLASGLTLRHYRNFEFCPSLPALAARVAAETPLLDHFGIHVMGAQNNEGEVVLGDSHEYDGNIEPFDKVQIDELVLRELHKIIRLPDWTIAERWHGLYVKHPKQPVFEAEPLPHVHICTGAGGSGMTMSFGLAERAWRRWSS